MSNWINTPDSSNISRFSYDKDAQVLTVEFHKGRVYDYFDVPKRIFEGMKSADSRGKYLHSEIKGKYRYAIK
jgi:hypothetical protein